MKAKTKAKQIVTALVACLMALALIACGGGSSPATETPTAPTITTQPANQSAGVGQTATFSVVASGSTTFTYQWKKNDSDIAGATSSTYTTPAISSGDNGAHYSVVVSNSAGTVTSNHATLSDVAITTQPAAQTVVEPGTVSFSVTATGTGKLAYQWKKNGSNIAGATSSTYTTPATTIEDNNALYSVVVSNSAGTVTSSTATLTVVPVAPIITTQPANRTINAGQTATFSVVATGTAPLSYQWKKNGSDISGATSSIYTTDATAMAYSETAYSVVVSNDLGTATSNNASLTVTVKPVISTQPEAQAVIAGQTATFTVVATGTAPLSYQWKKNGTDIPGATSSSYTTPATTMADKDAKFSVVVINSAGSVTSNEAKLTVNSFSLVANASGGFYDRTECVKDTTTGLVWEGKNSSGSRLGTSTYTNYDSTTSAQKWNGSAYVNPTQAEIDASTNSIGYRNSVRTSNLCGYNDWRLPTKEELHGILASSGNPRIDTAWFPNTQAFYYWSSSPYVGGSGYAWYVYFGDGYVDSDNRYNYGHVRLVR